MFRTRKNRALYDIDMLNEAVKHTKRDHMNESDLVNDRKGLDDYSYLKRPDSSKYTDKFSNTRNLDNIDEVRSSYEQDTGRGLDFNYDDIQHGDNNNNDFSRRDRPMTSYPRDGRDRYGDQGGLRRDRSRSKMRERERKRLAERRQEFDEFGQSRDLRDSQSLGNSLYNLDHSSNNRLMAPQP